MDSSSRIHTSPSFNRHSSNSIADIADRVVDELVTENNFHNDDVFIFSDGDHDHPAEVNTNTHTETVNPIEEDELEFAFPVISSDELVSDDQISPRYPLFDRSLLSDVDLDLCNSKTDSKSKRSPAARSSLMKLFADDRDAVSTSSSEADADDLDGITPGTYCVWTPKAEPKGKHKKSNSISTGNTSNRWKVRDLLKRSYSDDNYSSSGKDSPVLLFIPPISSISPILPISPNRKVNNEKVNKIDRTGKVDSSVGGGVAAIKAEKKIPAYKSKIGNIRLPPYLPYRQDQIAAFANFNGGKKDLYRY